MNWWAVIQSVLSGILVLLIGAALETSRRRQDERKKEIEELTARISQVRKDCERMVNDARKDIDSRIKEEVNSIDGDISSLYDKAEVQVDGLQAKVEAAREKNDECHRTMEKDVQLLHLEVKDLERDIPRNLHGIVMEQQREIERLRVRVGTRNGD